MVEKWKKHANNSYCRCWNTSQSDADAAVHSILANSFLQSWLHEETCLAQMNDIPLAMLIKQQQLSFVLDSALYYLLKQTGRILYNSTTRDLVL
jgi:hypothetical protein